MIKEKKVIKNKLIQSYTFLIYYDWMTPIRNDMSIINWLGNNVLSMLGIGASTFGAERSIASNERMQAQQLNHADTAATTAYIRQNELMDKMNLYNSPVQQMERYKAAGLNPYLMYGQGGGTISAASANVQQANTPSAAYQPNYYEGVASSLQNATNNYFQMKRLENDSKVADAQARSLLARAGLDDTQNRYDQETFSARKEAVELANLLTRSTKSKVDADKLLADAERELAEWKKDNVQASTAEINARRDYVMTQTAAQEILNKYLPRQQAGQLASLAAQAKMMASQGRLADARVKIEQFNAQTSRLFYNVQRDRFNYDRYSKDGFEREQSIRDYNLNDRREQHDYDVKTNYNNKDFFNDVMDIAKMAIGGAFDFEGSLETHNRNMELEDIRHYNRMDLETHKQNLRKK